MGLIEYILIAVGAIAVALLLITVVRRISAYYRQRHNMSIWAGVFLLTVATVLVAYSLYRYYRYNGSNIILYVIAGVIFLLTSFLDIRHAGFGMGLLALLLQLILAAGFIAVIIAAVIYSIIRALRRGDDMILDAVTGTTSGFRNGVQLFFRFFMP